MKKKKGAVAFESVLLSPLIFLMFMLCFYFLFVCLSYSQLANTANILAQSLNMRQTGYRDFRKSSTEEYIYGGMSSYMIVGDETDPDKLMFQIIGGTAREYTKEPIEIESINKDLGIKVNFPDLKNALYYSIDENINKLIAPGCEIKGIYVEAIKNGHHLTSFSKNISMSNTSIRVYIKYECFGIPFEVMGYNIIT